MNILITGITGFLGESLVTNFLSYNKSVNVKGVYRNSDKINPEFFSYKNFYPIHREIKDLNKKDLFGIDFVLHVAGPAANSSMLDSTEISKSIIEPTSHLLKLCHSLDKKTKFIYFSSGAVYGSSCKEGGFSESEPLQLNNIKDLYSSSKIYCESLCSYFSEYFPVIILRLFSFSGPKMKSSFPYALSEFISLSKKNIDIQIISQNEIIRSYLHTNDFYKTILKLLVKINSNKKFEGLEILNIGSKNLISIKTLAETIVNESRSKSKIFSHNNSKKSLRNNYYPNLSKLQKYISFEEISIKENINDTINNFIYEL